MIVDYVARIVWRHADYFPHGEPLDHSSRNAARAARPGDERVPDGSRHAFAGINGDGRVRDNLWRGAGFSFDFDGVDDADGDNVFLLIAGAEKIGALNFCESYKAAKKTEFNHRYARFPQSLPPL